MAKTSFKIATYNLLTAVKVFINELRGIHPSTGDKYYCPVCTAHLKYFKPIGTDYLKQLEEHAFIHPFFMLETSTITNFACPQCGSTDRDRLYALYFNERLSSYPADARLNIVDFAPQFGLRTFLKSNPRLNYRSADLYMKDVDDKVDIADMKIYKDASMDMFICSHILEYIKDDVKAMSELYRILKPGGWGIAMVPLILSIKETIEDPAKKSAHDQWQNYMDEGHIRMYSKNDFISRLERVGFKMKFLDKSHFGPDTFSKDGIQDRSILYIVEKPAS